MSSLIWRRKALTLLESIITFALLLGIMGSVAGIIKEYINVTRFAAQKDLALQSVEVALDRMSREVSQATKVTSPASAVAVPDLRFERIDPASTTRLPDPPSGLGPWNPAAPADIIRVHYYLLNGNLMREVQLSSGPLLAAPVALGVTSFSCQQDGLGNGLIQIQVALQERTRLAKYVAKALPRVR